jgi:hypothetical protein
VKSNATAWAVLDSVKIQNMAVDMETARANVHHALTLGLPEIDRLPEWGKFKRGEPIAIVAAGPSLKYTMAELAGFRAIMVAGSAHDFVVGRGVKPMYAVVVDPTPEVTASYLSKPTPTCNYLIASQCDKGLFEHLKPFPVTVWHCGGELNGVDLLAGHLPKGTMSLGGGGSTVGLRAIDIANQLGYYDLHLFGFDSCVDQNDQSHAFPLNDPSKEFVNGNGAEVIEIMVGATKDTGRKFRIPKYLLSQAWDFERMLKTSQGAARFTVHGDGLISHMVRMYYEAIGGM